MIDASKVTWIQLGWQENDSPTELSSASPHGVEISTPSLATQRRQRWRHRATRSAECELFPPESSVACRHPWLSHTNPRTVGLPLLHRCSVFQYTIPRVCKTDTCKLSQRKDLSGTIDSVRSWMPWYELFRETKRHPRARRYLNCDFH